MANEINWNPVLSTAGTAISTAANIYTSINNGKIKAIEMQMQAEQRASQAKIAGYETIAKLSNLDTQYQTQLADISENYANATQNQQLTAMMQGRTLDSLSSTASTDERAMQEDKQLSLLNKQSAEASLKTQRDIEKIQSEADVSNLNSAGNLAKLQGYTDASTATLSGVTTLAKNNAFDPKYYKKK